MKVHRNQIAQGCWVATLAVVLLYSFATFAQTPRNPFAVGGQEIGGRATGIMGWVLAEQSALYLKISNAVRAAKQNGEAFWGLAAISFAYGIFHAAGPGHGKAVIASYMLANERALRRGLVISFLAAILQGVVAVALIGIVALIFHATARAMNDAAADIDIASFAGIACLGLWLVWSKGTAFVTAWRLWRQGRSLRAALPVSAAVSAAPPTPLRTDMVEAHACHHDHHHPGTDHGDPILDALAAGGAPHAPITCDANHIHDAHCGHFHAPDPATLGADFSWRTALITLVAAGSRPCAGAILVLVFALSQGIFWAGVGATFAMALGTAITTGALACLAVLAKNVAARLAGGRSMHKELALRGLELAAALGVFVFGFGLLCGVLEYGA
jgi:nickel/cobalt transporter (NicO) family protein